MGEAQESISKPEGMAMTLEIVTVPCREDNYAYLVHDEDAGRTALVDACEAAPIQAALDAHGWSLDEIWLTHHHADHVEGLEALREGAEVVGAASDRHRLPRLDREVRPEDQFEFAGHAVRVIDVSGHTVGHVAFHLPDAEAVFTADSLMALGCGRLFEGTPQQMWESLCRLAELPDETLVYSGHEYTAANARFALTVEPDNAELISRSEDIDAARAEDRPTVPSSLALEKATNPFLRARLPEVKSAIGMGDASDPDAFAEIRRRKDSF
jgi:hydroxyacylglutathione hydrolase